MLDTSSRSTPLIGPVMKSTLSILILAIMLSNMLAHFKVERDEEKEMQFSLDGNLF